MNEKVLKWLYDIKIAIGEVEQFLAEKPDHFEYYKGDLLLKRAVERNLEIIGEAMSRILKEEPDIDIQNIKRIIGLRNQIIHSYDSLSDENIWGILTNHLPILKIEIQEKISEIEK
jgi:uncharacterized protein with HEPN domain